MMRSEYLVSKYSDTNMVYSNTMGIRVIMVDNMCLCTSCVAEISRKFPKFRLEGLRVIAENVAWC